MSFKLSHILKSIYVRRNIVESHANVSLFEPRCCPHRFRKCYGVVWQLFRDSLYTIIHICALNPQSCRNTIRSGQIAQVASVLWWEEHKACSIGPVKVSALFLILSMFNWHGPQEDRLTDIKSVLAVQQKKGFSFFGTTELNHFFWRQRVL
jgi:hypothetical protein